MRYERRSTTSSVPDAIVGVSSSLVEYANRDENSGCPAPAVGPVASVTVGCSYLPNWKLILSSLSSTTCRMTFLARTSFESASSPESWFPASVADMDPELSRTMMALARTWRFRTSRGSMPAGTAVCAPRSPARRRIRPATAPAVAARRHNDGAERCGRELGGSRTRALVLIESPLTWRSFRRRCPTSTRRSRGRRRAPRP